LRTPLFAGEAATRPEIYAQVWFGCLEEQWREYLSIAEQKVGYFSSSIKGGLMAGLQLD